MNTETNTDTVRVLKTASCPSLSGKSTLTYNIGCNALSVVQFQVAGNDGGGYFNDDWVPQSSIQAVLDKQPHGKDITSATFRAIYPSKSNNSPGFLLAVLKAIGLVRPSTTNQRCYELGSRNETNLLLPQRPQDCSVFPVIAVVAANLAGSIPAGHHRRFSAHSRISVYRNACPIPAIEPTK